MLNVKEAGKLSLPAPLENLSSLVFKETLLLWSYLGFNLKPFPEDYRNTVVRINTFILNTRDIFPKVLLTTVFECKTRSG